MPDNEIDDKKIAKDASETIDRIEGLLSGFLSFTGRYLKTIYKYLTTPSHPLQKSTGSATSCYTLKPLSFLTYSFLLFSLSYFRVLKELQDLNWISEEFKAAINRIVVYHDSIADSAFALKIADALFLVAPLVLLVGFSAKINELLSKITSKRSTMVQHLDSSCYFFGTITSMLSLWSIPILYFIAKYRALESTSNFEKAIGGAVIILAIGTILTAVFRFIQDGKNQFYGSWVLSGIVFIVASLIQLTILSVSITLFALGAV